MSENKAQETTGNPDIDAIINATGAASAAVAGDGANGQANGAADEPLKIKIGTEEFSIDEVKKWRTGNMLQADYTRKTQELAKERENVKNLLEVQKHLEEYPDKWERISAILDEAAEKEVAATGDISPELSKKIQAVDDKLLDIELKSLKVQYPDFNEKRVLKYAALNDLDNLETAYQELKKEDDAIRATVRQEVLESIKKTQAAGTAKFGGANSVAKNPIDPAKKGYNELSALALKELG